MKSILMSFKPQTVARILTGKQTIIIAKSTPKEVPFKVYIYCTSVKQMKLSDYTILHRDTDGMVDYWHGKVVAEFICMNVETFNVGSLRCDDIEKLACLTYKEMVNYFYKPIELNGNTQKWGKAIHITDLKIYDEPKELWRFRKECAENANCTKCEFYKIVDGGYECSPVYDCTVDEKKPITKPPATWMYVNIYKPN